MATERNYAERRGDVLRELDGLRAEVDAEKRIGTLILDREPLNIVSYRGRSQICALIEAFDEDDDVDVIVIRGANGVFSSGGDVKRFPEIPKNKMFGSGGQYRCAGALLPSRSSRRWKNTRSALPSNCRLPCDFRFATKDTQVGLPEVAIGQMPGSGGSVRVARLIGMTRAKDMVMLGKRLPGAEGLRLGPADRRRR